MNMTVKDFIENYNARVADIQKENLIKSIIKTEPLGIAAKRVIANTIAKQCMYRNDVFYQDSIKRFYLTMIALITNYTTLELEKGNEVNDFDLLNQSNVLDLIIKAIDPKEYSELNTIIQMACDDVVMNETSFTSWVNGLIGKLEPTLNSLQDVMNNLDEDQVNKIVDFAKAAAEKSE